MVQFTGKVYIKPIFANGLYYRNYLTPSGTYEILHTKNFNPNSKDYISHKRRVKLENLSAELINLCNGYYNLSACNTKSADILVNEIEEHITVQEHVY